MTKLMVAVSFVMIMLQASWALPRDKRECQTDVYPYYSYGCNDPDGYCSCPDLYPDCKHDPDYNEIIAGKPDPIRDLFICFNKQNQTLPYDTDNIGYKRECQRNVRPYHPFGCNDPDFYCYCPDLYPDCKYRPEPQEGDEDADPKWDWFNCYNKHNQMLDNATVKPTSINKPGLLLFL